MHDRTKEKMMFVGAMVFAAISFVLSLPFVLVAAWLERWENVPVVTADRVTHLRRVCQAKRAGDILVLDGNPLRITGVNAGPSSGFFQIFLEQDLSVISDAESFEVVRRFPRRFPFGTFKRIPFQTIE